MDKRKFLLAAGAAAAAALPAMPALAANKRRAKGESLAVDQPILEFQ